MIEEHVQKNPRLETILTFEKRGIPLSLSWVAGLLQLIHDTVTRTNRTPLEKAPLCICAQIKYSW